jgi:hypothetical protein
MAKSIIHRPLAFCLLASALGLACEDDALVESSSQLETGGTEDTGQPGSEGPAILTSAFVRTPEGRNIYVGAVTELPDGELDYSRFLEFGNVDVFTHAGYVFVWDREPAIMTRFSVREDMSLEEGPRVSLASAVPGVGRHIFISETRAYTLSSTLEGLVVWNPTTMEITGSVPLDPPDVDPALQPNVGFGVLAGNQAIWPIEWGNNDSLSVRKSATVAIANTGTDDPLLFVDDPRCSGAIGGRVDDNGDYYVYAMAGAGRFAAYGAEAADVRTCILKVAANDSRFDPDYLVDLRELTGTYINRGWFHIRGSHFLAYVWDSANALPEEWQAYNNASTFRTLLVDLESQSVEPYPHVGSGPLVTFREFGLDGVAYHEQVDPTSESGSAVGVATDVVELRPESAPRRFTFNPGNLWSLGRIR